MTLPSILPRFTESDISPKGALNIEDLRKILRNMLVFLTPTILLYLAQLTGALSAHLTLNLADLIPSTFVIGAFEGYVISTVIDYLKKLNAGGGQ
jgi:hypothetical protein